MAGLFGGTPAPASTQQVPETPAPTPMVDEEAIMKKKKEAIARNQQRGGRTSTILSDAGSDTLG